MLQYTDLYTHEILYEAQDIAFNSYWAFIGEQMPFDQAITGSSIMQSMESPVIRRI